jgi:3-methyladenine DNA glycosylase AlkD
MTKIQSIINDIKKHGSKEKAKHLARFFKTGKGQYGEGGLFLGITVPVSRQLAKKYSDLKLPEISLLLKNEYHEVRLIALLILVHQYKSSQIPGIWESSRTPGVRERKQEEIVGFYLKNTKYINNWDLVDLSAHYIIGDYFYHIGPSSVQRTVLCNLVRSKNLWERRIAIISTFAFIYKGESKPTLHIVKMLLNDHEDLIHKACGWMLREVGKRVREADLTAFLDLYSPQMPRTMLRYAIERLPEKKRRYYLHREYNTKHKIC